MIPESLLQTIRGFQESRAILTAIELDLFAAVGTGGTAEEIAVRAGTNPRATEMLLNALASLDLVRKDGSGRYSNTETGEELRAGRQGLMHTVNLWVRWSTLTDCVRAGTAVLDRDVAARDEDWTEAFIAAMHRNASERAPAVVKAIGADSVRRMLDLGGGSGAYSIAFAQANPQLQADILDLPRVTAIAERHIAAAGVQDRVGTRTGDIYGPDYGTGYDFAWVSQICHMMGPEENRSMLRKCYCALAPGGRIAIQDFILNADKTGPHMATLFALNMLVGTRNGNTYSAEEYTEWLREAGFRDSKHVPLPGPSSLMVAVKPA